MLSTSKAKMETFWLFQYTWMISSSLEVIQALFKEFKRMMTKELEMTNIKLMVYYLGVKAK